MFSIYIYDLHNMNKVENCSITCFSDVVVRALAKFIRDHGLSS